MIGTTISQYKILEKLGEGGMGIVYKAQDTTLDRLVALKFMPPHLSASAEDKARFIQEAKSAATLNHANICTIHDIKEEEGRNFIVMEFVDGVTLRDKFAEAPVPVKEAVAYAIQIGEALEEAHSKGIVHRDIKSDNIMVTKKNQVKVMDFGLAKLKGSLKLTRATSTVGTLGYMAPEQIQGSEADVRSDIFSFGVVLFELMTARLPFRGEHEAAMVYSIVNEEPESLLKFVPDAPPELLHILATALEKDPNDRYQTAAEMTRELRRMLKQSSRVSRTSSSSSRIPIAPAYQPEVQPVVKSKKMLWVSLAVGAVLLAAVAVVFLTTQKKEEVVATVSLNPNMTLRVLPIPFAQFSYPGLSADGNWVAFPAADANNKWDIFYMHVSGSETRRISADSMVTGENVNADISPDGSQVVYDVIGQTNVDMKLVSSVGGIAKTLISGNIVLPRWRPDGQRIGYVRTVPRGSGIYYALWSVKPDGGDSRLEYADSLSVASRFSYAWSPDGHSVAWIRSFKGGYQEVFARELVTGAERQLTFDKKNNDDVAWTRNGFVIFSSNRGGNTNLWMVPSTGGTPQQLTKGSGPDIGISVSADDRKLVYLQQQRVGHIWISDLTSSASRQLTIDDREITSANLSPDGKSVALTMGESDPLKPGINLYIQDRASGNRRQLTDVNVPCFNPQWSPDGKWIAFCMNSSGNRGDSSKIFLVEASNPGVPREMGYGTAAVWVSSNKFVAQRVRRPHDDLLSVDGGPPEQFYQDSTTAIKLTSENAILYFDQRKATTGFWLLPAGDATKSAKSKSQKVSDIPKGATFKSFSSSYIYFTIHAGELWRQSFRTGRQEQLKGSFSSIILQSPMAVGSDDKEFLSIVQQFNAKLVMIENIFK